MLVDWYGPMGMEKAIWNCNTDSQSPNKDFWIVASGYYTSDVPLLACLLFGGADMLKPLTPPTSRCLKWNMPDQQRTWCKATCPVFPCTEGTYTIYIHLKSSKSWFSERLVFDVFGAPGSEFRGVVPEDLKTLSIRSLMKRLVVFLYRTGAT
jgi:hypothetical protein